MADTRTVTVTIRRRPSISDPQGATVARALRDLGHEVTDVRIDKTIELQVPDGDVETIRARVAEMCDRLLANPVMEDYEILVSS
ncbi:MAG: phosphoribosylformylglycinamidine synthase subunit PurS [Acidimicrobiia bacterium]|nr:phosphoribosylformylglycinamidine synthase subunit PurS [Acidimicrobiia bacterium]MDH5420843.1 phosphoribosylformylglycinamidine synthase subunit PurS [Acidimicrobiia bacterium]MDH5504263.1 phosphoribosylformylglycinamidine synthase subunit PurS [Acidimicrobiia bacterium]